LAKKKNKEKAPREMTHRQLSHHKKALRRQRIIFFSGVGIIVAVILIIVGGWFAGEYMPLHKTVLQVYDTKFDASFYVDTLVVYGRSQGSTGLSTITSSVASQIIQDELFKQEAGKLGISVSDDEATQYLQNVGIAVNNAAIELARGALLSEKVKSTHFSSLQPDSANQVYMRAVLTESISMAQLVREKIVNGENFTLLAEEYAGDTSSKTKKGDYGWHPASILIPMFSSTLPLDYAFSLDVKTGDISQPLSDNATYKQIGYWLIRVNEKPDEESANVSAILLGSLEEALAIRAQLEAGAELAPIADKYSQYSPSKEKHGEMGWMLATDNITNAYNAYVFDPSTEIGKWSQPIRDSAQYTQGGAWLVQVVGKEENRKLSDEDRKTLIDNLFTEWFSSIWTAATSFITNSLDEDVGLQQWAVERATKELANIQVQ
jgi:parvulin-like peptidyl-prolyl isomerase